MVWMKNCPRCGGDIYCESDVYGSYIECAQCAFLRDVSSEALWRARRLGRWFLSDPVEFDLGKVDQQKSMDHVEV